MGNPRIRIVTAVGGIRIVIGRCRIRMSLPVVEAALSLAVIGSALSDPALWLAAVRGKGRNAVKRFQSDRFEMR